MRLAIVTAFHEATPPHLQQCIDSIANQSYRDYSHILVGDGISSLPSNLTFDSRVLFVSLPVNINDYGDSPRSIGATYAYSMGYDAVMFLDSDNWVDVDHLETVVKCQEKFGSSVVTCNRKIFSMSGEYLGNCPESDGVNFSDTNCILFTSAASEIATSGWSMPREHHCIGDRIIWNRVLKSGMSIGRTNAPTVNYRTNLSLHYDMFNIPHPVNVNLGDIFKHVHPDINYLIKSSHSLLSKYRFNKDRTLLYR